MIPKAVFELTLKMGKKIPVQVLPHINEGIVNKVKQCKKFKDYVKKIENAQKDVQVRVQMFGEKVGFVNLKATTAKDGFNLPSYVFLRGPAVAILMLVNDKLLVVEQYRVPIQQTIIQAPAGMLDESGDFVGQAAAQIQQETSIKITHNQLISLGSYYPSVGGSDQEIYMYYCKIKIPEKQMQEIQQKIHGKDGESEKIKVKLINYDPKTILATKDSKLICLMLAYENNIGKMKQSKQQTKL